MTTDEQVTKRARGVSPNSVPPHSRTLTKEEQKYAHVRGSHAQAAIQHSGGASNTLAVRNIIRQEITLAILRTKKPEQYRDTPQASPEQGLAFVQELGARIGLRVGLEAKRGFGRVGLMQFTVAKGGKNPRRFDTLGKVLDYVLQQSERAVK